MHRMILVLLLAAAGIAFGQDSLNVRRIGSLPAWYFASDLALHNDHALVATGSTGLRILDIASPSTPYEVAAFDSGYFCGPQAVTTNGDFAFVTDSTGTLCVVDLSNYLQPHIVGTWESHHDSNGGATLTIVGNYLFISDGSQHLYILDVSTPTSPIVVYESSHMGDIFLRSHVVVPPYLYGISEGSVLSLDISNPAQPIILDALTSSAYRVTIAISGNMLYVINRDSTMSIIDASNPANLSLAGTLELPTTARYYYAALAVDGNTAFASTDGNFFVIDVSNPALPQILGSLPIEFADLSIRDGLVYGIYNHGLAVINVSNPSQPNIQGSFRTLTSPLWVEVSGEYAFVTDDFWQLSSVFLGNPAQPLVQNSSNFLYWTSDVRHNGSYLYFTSLGSGLRIMDVSDPQLPVMRGQIENVLGRGVVVNGNYAYIAATGIRICDVSNADTPVVVNSIDTPAYVNDLAIAGGQLLYVSAGDTLLIYDLANPTDPHLLGQVGLPYFIYDIVTHDNLLILNTRSSIRIFSLSDPTQPQLLGTISDTVRAMDIVANYLVTGSQVTQSVRVYNISDPANAALTGYQTFEPGSNAIYDIAVQNYLVYLPRGEAFEIYDISEAMSVPPAHVSLPDAIALHPAYPNPFNARATIGFDLPAETNVKLTVFDILGRNVATLAEGKMNAGQHRISFDGSDLPSGVYIYRLDAGGFLQSKKMVLLR